MIAYQLSKIAQRYDDKTVLEIDSLEIESGSIFALLGPNGAGKTTLLNILAFLAPPASGSIRFFNENIVFRETRLQKHRKRVVLVSQNPILFTASVFKNLEFGLRLRRINRQRRINLIEESLDLVGMRRLIQARANKLSGGETQRVAIARALALSPDVLLCDEPTSSVDLENQSVIIDLLRRINEEKQITLIFTSHDRFQATSLARNIIFMDNGSICNTPQENLFSAKISDASGGRSICNIYQRIELVMNRAAAGEARIMIDPAGIEVNTRANSPSNSALRGKVSQVTEESGAMRIVVDGPIRLNVLMPTEKYRREPIPVGDEVILEIAPDAIQALN